jgi:hypothetical protein
VRLDDETVETRCVTFTEEQISGMEVLNRSGLAADVEYGSVGGAVCQIEDTGCPVGDCFCQCKGSDCIYWSYWHLQENNWQYSSIGAAVYQVQDGTIEGWSWGPGAVTQAIEPPHISFEEVCSARNENEPRLSPTEETTGLPDWQSYTLFGIILVVMVGIYLIMRSRRPQ